MLEEIPEHEEIIERIAALDIGKAELVCCVRVPGGPGKSRHMQEVTTYKTMTRSLLVMIERLCELGVTRVIMEATEVIGNRASTCSKRPDSRLGWSTPTTSNTCQAVPKPTNSIRCGCVRSPNDK
jgi:hypothetical protein